MEPSVQIVLSPAVKTDVGQFIDAMKHEPIDLERLGVEGIALEEILTVMERMFAVLSKRG